MIHSASLRATGSAIVAWAWVASAGLCLRTSSMTFSSALLSACEVDEVAAIVAGVNLTDAATRGAVLFVDAWSTTLRAIGRALGNGTFGLAQASAPKPDKPTTSARLVASAVDRKTAERLDRVKAFPQGESFDRASPMSI